MMTNNVHLLDIKRVENLAQQVRGNLANLRRLKMTRGSALAGQRNPALDGFFDDMIEMRRELLGEIATLDADLCTAHIGKRISGIAGQVLGDLDEMIELLICLGAAKPDDRENWLDQNSV